MTFGLIAVDRTSRERFPKKSLNYLGAMSSHLRKMEQKYSGEKIRHFIYLVCFYNLCVVFYNEYGIMKSR